MKPMMNCSDDTLRLLLREDEQSDEYRDAAPHVDSCPHCRQRIGELAAENDEWHEAHEMLLAGDESDTATIDRLSADERSRVRRQRPPTAWTEAMARQLLSPPSHPEMLGRIGRYEVERLIGTGGMGVVFKAFDTELNRPVAVKLLTPYLAGSGAARKRFSREARAAAAVVHEHVVSIHNVETEGEVPFLVMQYVPGESLQSRLDREGALDVCEILRIGMQTASGLAAAHAQGLVHRDVKPSNVLLEKGVERSLLTDFGLARASDDASLTRTGHHLGTPQYMSPEQARGDAVDARSDLFSLGSVMYAMCTGRPPFRAETSYGVLRRITDAEPRSIREINPNIPEWLERLTEKLLAKSLENRFQTAEEVAELLQQCLAHVQQPTSVPLPTSLMPRTAGRRSISNASPLGVIAIMLGTIGMTLLGMLLMQATGDGKAATSIELGKIQPPGGVPLSIVKPGTKEIGVDQLNKVKMRLESVPAEVLEKWVVELERIIGKKLTDGLPSERQACRTDFAIRLSVAFDELKWNSKAADELFKRAQSMPASEAKDWKEAFESLLTKEIGQTNTQVMDGGPEWAVPLVLIPVDALHEEQKYSTDRGKKYLARLKQLTADDVSLWKDEVDEFGGTNLDAAVNIILLDDFFDEVGFKRDKFKNAVEAKMIVSIGPKAPKESKAMKPPTKSGAEEPTEVSLYYDIHDLPIWDKEGRFQNTDLLCHYLGLDTDRTKAHYVPLGSYDQSRMMFRVRANTAKHQKVERLLADLRASSDPADMDLTKSEIRVYAIADLPLWSKDGKRQDMKLLMHFLRSTIDPPSWESQLTRAAYDAKNLRLLVQATPEIHNRIAAVLASPLPDPVVADSASIIACVGPKMPIRLGAIIAHEDIHKGLESTVTYLHVWDWSKSDVSRVMLVQKSELGVLSPNGTTMVSLEGEAYDVVNGGSRQYFGFEVSDDQVITSLRFSLSGKYVAAMIRPRTPHASDRNDAPPGSTLRLLELDAATKSQKVIGEFPANASAGAAFSADETSLIYSNGEHGITRRDATNGNILNEYQPGVRAIHGAVGISASPDGRFVAVADYDGSIYVWETKSGRLLVTHQGLVDAASTDFQAKVMRFSPDGAHLALVSGNRLHVMETATGKIVKNEEHETTPAIAQAQWSPDGKTITLLTSFQPTNYVDKDGVASHPTANIFPRVYEWDWREGSPKLKKFAEAPQAQTKNAEIDLAPQPAGEAAKSTTGLANSTPNTASAITARVHYLNTARSVKIACSADGKLIAIAHGGQASPAVEGWSRSVEILEAETGKSVVVISPTTKDEEAVLDATEGIPFLEDGALAFSPDGSLLAVGTGLGQVKLFNPITGELILALDDEPAKLAEQKTPAKFKSLKRAMGSVRSLAFSPDGTRLAMCGSSFDDAARNWGGVDRLGRRVTGPGRVKMWDVKTGALIHDLAGHSHADTISFSADGNLLASAGRWSDKNDDGTGVIIWDAQTGKKLRTIPNESNGGTHAVAFSPMGNLLAIGSRQFDKTNDTSTTTVSVVHAMSGIMEWQQIMPGWAIPRTFSPDGKSLLVFCGGESIRFFDTETGIAKHEIRSVDSPHGGRWHDIALPQQGHRLAIGGVDNSKKGTVEIWDFLDKEVSSSAKDVLEH